MLFPLDNFVYSISIGFFVFYFTTFAGINLGKITENASATMPANTIHCLPFYDGRKAFQPIDLVKYLSLIRPCKHAVSPENDLFSGILRMKGNFLIYSSLSLIFIQHICILQDSSQLKTFALFNALIH